MALIRPIRLPPSKPTRQKLLNIMRDYGLRRKTIARLMCCSLHAVDCYLAEGDRKYAREIPQIRWNAFLMVVQTIYHPDEEMESQL